MGNSLDKEKFKVLLKGLKSFYPADWFIPNEEAANLWYRMLMDISYEALNLGITKFIQTSSKEPTVADIRKAAKEFMPDADPELSEQEAWLLVRKAVRNSGYNSESEYAKLPPVLQKAVGSPSNLKEWGMMDVDQFETVQQSQFLRSYRATLKRSQEISMISPAVQKHLTATADNLDVKKIIEKKADPLKIEETKGVPMPERLKEKYKELFEKIDGKGGDEDGKSGIHPEAGSNSETA